MYLTPVENMLKQLQQAAAAANGTAPSFTQKPNIRQSGGKIIVECQASCTPAPNVTWMFNGKVVMSGGKYLVGMKPNGNNNFLLSLEIADLSMQDAGEYKAVAKNPIGEASATLMLSLEGEDRVQDSLFIKLK